MIFDFDEHGMTAIHVTDEVRELDGSTTEIETVAGVPHYIANLDDEDVLDYVREKVDRSLLFAAAEL